MTAAILSVWVLVLSGGGQPTVGVTLAAFVQKPECEKMAAWVRADARWKAPYVATCLEVSMDGLGGAMTYRAK